MFFGSRRFLAARDGSAAVVFAVCLIPIVIAVGGAVDYAYVIGAKAKVQQATDAAALAGATAASQGNDPVAAATTTANAALATVGSPSVVVTPSLSVGNVQVQTTVAIPNRIVQIIGISTSTVTATSTAHYGAGGGLGQQSEYVFAFDTTGSMAETDNIAGTKLATAQQAATNLVNQLLYLPGSSMLNSNVKVGLVPFTDYVNIGLQYRDSYWLSGSDDYATTGAYSCYNTYPNATYTNPVTVQSTCVADGVSYSCPYTSYTVNYGTPVQVCSTPTYNYTWYGCVGSQSAPGDEQDVLGAANQVPALLNYSCPNQLIRMTNTPSTITSAIAAMSANGETYIAPGLLWAWRVLSPNPPFADGQPYGSASKTIILMTDGANTHSADYAPTFDHEGSSVSDANTKLQTVCANVKAAGIKLYVIAFEVSDPSIQSILSSCASTGGTYFYNAQTSLNLQQAYAAIGASLTHVRLVN